MLEHASRDESELDSEGPPGLWRFGARGVHRAQPSRVGDAHVCEDEGEPRGNMKPKNNYTKDTKRYDSPSHAMMVLLVIEEKLGCQLADAQLETTLRAWYDESPKVGSIRSTHGSRTHQVVTTGTCLPHMCQRNVLTCHRSKIDVPNTRSLRLLSLNSITTAQMSQPSQISSFGNNCGSPTLRTPTL